MQQYMSTYKVTLETKGPLYIGSGKQLGKKEYIHNRQKKEIVVPNLIKMYQQLKKKNLTGEYEKFLLNPKEKDLYMWLVNKGITYAESKNGQNILLIVQMQYWIGTRKKFLFL